MYVQGGLVLFRSCEAAEAVVGVNRRNSKKGGGMHVTSDAIEELSQVHLMNMNRVSITQRLLEVEGRSLRAECVVMHRLWGTMGCTGGQLIHNWSVIVTLSDPTRDTGKKEITLIAS